MAESTLLIQLQTVLHLTIFDDFAYVFNNQIPSRDIAFGTHTPTVRTSVEALELAPLSLLEAPVFAQIGVCAITFAALDLHVRVDAR